MRGQGEDKKVARPEDERAAGQEATQQPACARQQEGGAVRGRQEMLVAAMMTAVMTATATANVTLTAAMVTAVMTTATATVAVATVTAAEKPQSTKTCTGKSSDGG